MQQYRDRNKNLMNQINGIDDKSSSNRKDNRSGTESSVFARMYPKEAASAETAAGAIGPEDVDFYWDNPEQMQGHKKSEILE